jgi:membrane associated rhomboid family serine protease
LNVKPSHEQASMSHSGRGTEELDRRRPPWEQPDLLPERPSAESYGYLARGTMRECSREELVERCSAKAIGVGAPLTWTPETPRLVPITEVPLLADAVDSWIRASIRQSVLMVLLGTLWASIPLIFLFQRLIRRDDVDSLVSPLPIAVLVVPGVVALMEAVAARRALRRRRHGVDKWAPDLAARFGYWLGSRNAVFTWIVAGIIALVGACQLIGGLTESVASAGLVKTAVSQGQVWRLLTGTMLHGSLLHLGVNLGALMTLGRATEALAARGRLAIVLLVSFLSGSLLSLVLLPDTTSIGASGGLMGLLGFLIVLGIRYKRVLPREFVGSLVKGALWVAMAGLLAHAHIDNAAHAGGFLGGLGLGLLLVPSGENLPLGEGRFTRGAGLAAFAVLVLVALASAALVLRLI